VRGCLDFSDWLHESISNHELNVGAGVALSFGPQLPVIILREGARSRPHMELEHLEKEDSFDTARIWAYHDHFMSKGLHFIGFMVVINSVS